MRRTLTVLVTAAALLVPATAASAAPPVKEGKKNASCNSGKQRGPGSMFAQDGTGYNGGGNYEKAIKGIGCGGVDDTDDIGVIDDTNDTDDTDDTGGTISYN